MPNILRYGRPTWRMVIYDRNGFPIGPIYDASSRKLQLAINGIDTLDFSIRLDHPAAAYLRPYETIIKVWRTISIPQDTANYYNPQDPIFCGIVGPMDQGGESNQIPITVKSPFWMLQNRYVRELLQLGNPLPLVGPAMDAGEIAMYLIDYTNQFGETGIVRGDIEPTQTIRQAYEVRQEIWKAIEELTQSTGGFDIYPRYVHLGDGDKTLMIFNVASSYGIAQPKIQLHYNVGRKNLKDITRRFETEGFCTSVDVDGQGDGLTASVHIEDSDAVAKYGLWERVDKLDNILDTGSLADHGNSVLDHFSDPPQVIEPVLTPRIGPHFGRDYGLGDIVAIRAHKALLDFGVMKRVYGATLEMDDSNFETTSLTTSRDTSGQIEDNGEDFFDFTGSGDVAVSSGYTAPQAIDDGQGGENQTERSVTVRESSDLDIDL